ncbi:hypothetical protein [Spiroplasma endosymbiont of Aspidapion aeneum]|uniref:hypothetical protein n=1 Tax=Spiroplasma endosymbiont of Aspidapion aeneum TaxID=3066276 RepID=UPI00313CB2F0
MSFKTDKIIIKNKKIEEQLDFNVENKEIVNVFYNYKSDSKWLIKFLKGKNKTIISGDILINDDVALDKYWIKKRNAFIKKEIFTKILNAKYWMFFCLFFNHDFYLYVKEDYIIRRYKYLNYLKANGSQTSINLRDSINKLVSEFVDSSIKIEKKWLQEYLDYICKFNNIQIDKQKYKQEFKNILKDFYQTKESILNLTIEERFHQSVWDKVYHLLDLNSSCMCEYNITKSKNKDFKKIRKHLKFREQEYVVREVLSLLDLKIRLIKRKILKTKRELKNIKILLSNSLKNIDKNLTIKKLFKILSDWTILSKDQRYEFTKKQDKIIVETLQSEGDILKGKVIELIHSYHKDIIADDITYIDQEYFKIEKQELSKKYNTISLKIWEWVNKQCDTYGIIINNLSFDIKGINSIFMSLLKSIFLKKKNLFLINVLSMLNIREKRYFFDVLNNIIRLNDSISIIIIDSNFENIYNLDKDVYLVKEQKILKIQGKELLSKNIKIFKNTNNLKIIKENGSLFINNQKIKFNLEGLFEGENDIFINPFELTKSTDSFYKFNIKVNDNKNCIDPNLIEGEDEFGNKFLFYSKDKYKKNERVKLYLRPKSIIIEENGG